MTQETVGEHLAIVDAANPVPTVRRGREKRHHLNAPSSDTVGRWIHRHGAARVQTQPKIAP